MQIILMEKVANLGNLGDVVKVKDGYARNFLIPGKPRAPRTEPRSRNSRAPRRTGEGAAEKLAAAQALAASSTADGADRQKAGVDGRLFGSVTNADIAEALQDAGLRDPKSQVRMPKGPLKTGRRPHRVGGAAHRRGRRHHRLGGRRSRLTGLSALCRRPVSTGLLHCAPSMGAILEVQVLRRAGHSKASEAQLREGDRAWRGSVERKP